jgi:hypothetical protein
MKYVIFFILIIIITILICRFFKDFYSPYRLGDMFAFPGYYIYGKKYQCRYRAENYHYKAYPESIATQYMKQTKEPNNYTILMNIIDQNINVKNIKLPNNDTVIIHVRIGDIIENSKISDNNLLYMGDKKYVKPLSYYKKNLQILKKYNLKNVILVAGSHKNINLNRSVKYLQDLKSYIESLGYNVHIKFSKSADYKQADEDFIFMTNSKYFISSGGGFSNIIKNIVQRKGNIAL